MMKRIGERRAKGKSDDYGRPIRAKSGRGGQKVAGNIVQLECWHEKGQSGLEGSTLFGN